jgi:hypothetical protein
VDSSGGHGYYCADHALRERILTGPLCKATQGDRHEPESTAVKDVHVLGDSIQIAPGMPESGHMANGEAKVAAASIAAQLAGWNINPAPMLSNTCYNYVDDQLT